MRSKNYASNKPTATDRPDNTIPDNLSPPCAFNEQSTRSTRSGPRTEAGKKRSSMNATRHGLSGRIVVLPSEDMSLYMQQSKEIVDSLYPETPIERKLAQTVADGYWRLERFRTIEEGMFAWGHYEEAGDFDAADENIHSAFTAAAAFRANSKAFVNLSIYEQRIQRGIEKAMKQLKELQAERKDCRQREMDKAIRLRDYHNMLQTARQADNNVVPIHALPYNPPDDQFVYSSAEVEDEARRRDRNSDAWLASTVGFDHEEYLKKAA